LAQTYANWELIVVDNGSSDNTQEVLTKYSDSRIRKLHIEVNEGPVKAWAKGYQQTQGDYFALLPADDVFTPRKLARQISFLDANRDIQCVGTYIDVIDDDGKVLKKRHWMTDTVNIPMDYSNLAEWRWKHHFCIPTALYDKVTCERAGGVPLDGLTNICDWDFHVRLLGAGAHFAVIPERLTLYRWHGSNTSRQKHNTHNQWVYSHIRSFLPALRALAPDYNQEMGQCIETLYFDPRSSYYLEEAPVLWRCAHLEALLRPANRISDFPTYYDFLQHTERWEINTEERAAIAALDSILMTLRRKLLRTRPLPTLDIANEKLFPIEQEFKEIASLLGWPLMNVIYFLCKVKREMRRGSKKLSGWLGRAQKPETTA